VGGHLGLPADGALLAPAEGGDLFGEICLEAALGGVAGDDAVTEALPFVEVLELGDDGRVGTEAVPSAPAQDRT
jgi:hypothetical protein